jgi:hypothetical protein
LKGPPNICDEVAVLYLRITTVYNEFGDFAKKLWIAKKQGYHTEKKSRVYPYGLKIIENPRSEPWILLL